MGQKGRRGFDARTHPSQSFNDRTTDKVYEAAFTDRLIEKCEKSTPPRDWREAPIKDFQCPPGIVNKGQVPDWLKDHAVMKRLLEREEGIVKKGRGFTTMIVQGIHPDLIKVCSSRVTAHTMSYLFHRFLPLAINV